MTPCWEGLWGLWRWDENSKNGDVIWIGAGVRYTFRQEWWTAQMWDGECWQLLPGSTFPCGPLSVLQILVAHRVHSATVVFISPEFVRAWPCRGSGLSWTLDSWTGFPYEALRVTIGQWAVTQPCTWRLPFTYMEQVCAHSAMFLPPLVTAVCHTVCSTLISWVDSEAAGISNVAYSVNVQGLARSLRSNRCHVFLRRWSRNAKSNIYGNTIENAKFFQPSGAQGRVVCRTFRKSSFPWLCFALFCPVWWDCGEWESEPSKEDWHGRVNLTTKGMCEQSSHARRYNEGNNFSPTFTG